MQPEMTDDLPRPRERKRHGLVRDVLEVLIIAVVLYIAIWSALQTVRVDGESMVGTLQNNDLLLASKISYYFADPQRGDIVVLIPPSDPTKDFIKRVIGVPGDTLEIDGAAPGGTAVLVKPGGKGPWQRLVEPYIPTAQPWNTMNNCCTSDGKESPTPAAYSVPTGDYFVMGDNRDFSSDSRMFGVVPRKNILAKAFVRILPFARFGLGSGPTLAPDTTAALLAPAVPAMAVALPCAGLLGLRRRRRAQREARGG